MQNEEQRVMAPEKAIAKARQGKTEEGAADAKRGKHQWPKTNGSLYLADSAAPSQVQRVGYVLNIFPKLSETFILGELIELLRRGIHVRILSLLPPRDLLRHKALAEAGLDKLVYYERAAFEGLLRNFRPQLLHAHFATESTAVARELAERLGVPFTFTAHGYDIFRKPPADFAQRAAAASALITVSHANADYVGKTYGVAAKHIHIIPCGIDVERFRPAVHDGRNAGTDLLVCVARQVEVKNLELLLQGCARLRQMGHHFRCALIGDGPKRRELQALRAELGLAGLVEMPGPAEQGEVLKWWQRAAIGVLTSHNEGMPVSLMEAAACGVPVVATRVGGVPELVQDGLTGLLVPPGEPEVLASALGRLLSAPAVRKCMGIAARKRAVEQFSVSRQVEQLLALWTEVVRRK